MLGYVMGVVRVFVARFCVLHLGPMQLESILNLRTQAEGGGRGGKRATFKVLLCSGLSLIHLSLPHFLRHLRTEGLGLDSTPQTL